MQMGSSVLENPVWWRWLQKQCVFDDIFPWRTHTHTLAFHSHSHTHKHTNSRDDWNSNSQKQPAPSIKPSLCLGPVQKDWQESMVSKKRRASIFIFPHVIPPRERGGMGGGAFFSKMVSNRDRGRQYESFVRETKWRLPSPTFPFFSPDRDRKKKSARTEGGREREGGGLEEKEKKRIALLKPS